jgi:hypothetical protein
LTNLFGGSQLLEDLVAVSDHYTTTSMNQR